MGKTFRKVNVCLAGDFGVKAEKVRQWVEANGGRLSKHVDRNVTHLITTKDAFRKRVAYVREARRIKKIKIVSIDWLEDSLLSKDRRPKREGPYLWRGIVNNWKMGGIENRGTRKALAIADADKRLRKESRAGPQLTGLDGYHIYKDKLDFVHFVVLVRPIATAGFKEKYTLNIYQSDAVPHLYATFVKYTRVGRMGTDFLAPPGSPWELAFDSFTKFFKAKSGKHWSKRMSNLEPAPKKNREGCVLPADEGWFQYEDSATMAVSSL